jgi:hypothetical protein
MKIFLRERKILIFLYKFLIIFDNWFVNVRIRLFFFLRLQLYFLKFINIVFRRQNIIFDKIGIFKGFLYLQKLLINFTDCKFLLFNLFMDFVYLKPSKFIKKDFIKILKSFFILYFYKNIKIKDKFLILLNDFLNLYYIYGEEVILKFLINLNLFSKFELIKNFIDFVYLLNKHENIKLEIKLVLYKVLNKLDLFILDKHWKNNKSLLWKNNKSLLWKNNKSLLWKNNNKILLLMLNLYLFWFLFYLERFIIIFSKFIFLLWVFIVKQFFLCINLFFLNCDLTYFFQINLNELNLLLISLNNKFYNKNLLLFTYRFITLQNYSERWFLRRRRMKKRRRFYLLKIFKYRSLV